MQNFETLRQDGYLYVDKTGLIYKLADTGCYFFLSPRQFGKSLLVSTIEAYLKGERRLFKGIVRRAYEKTDHRVAVLVDGYDKPFSLLNALKNKRIDDYWFKTS